jgi:hypothetical protein
MRVGRPVERGEKARGWSWRGGWIGVDIERGKEEDAGLAGMQLAMLSAIQRYDDMIYPFRCGRIYEQEARGGKVRGCDDLYLNRIALPYNLIFSGGLAQDQNHVLEQTIR